MHSEVSTVPTGDALTAPWLASVVPMACPMACTARLARCPRAMPWQPDGLPWQPHWHAPWLALTAPWLAPWHALTAPPARPMACHGSPMACLDSPVASPMAPHGLAHGLPQGTPRHTRGALPTMSSTQRSDEEHRRSHKLYKSNLPCCLKRLQYNTHNMAPQCCHPTCMNGGEHLSRAFGQLKPPKLVS